MCLSSFFFFFGASQKSSVCCQLFPFSLFVCLEKLLDIWVCWHYPEADLWMVHYLFWMSDLCYVSPTAGQHISEWFSSVDLYVSGIFFFYACHQITASSTTVVHTYPFAFLSTWPTYLNITTNLLHPTMPALKAILCTAIFSPANLSVESYTDLTRHITSRWSSWYAVSH